MTVTATHTFVTLTGNGVATAFPFDFSAASADEVRVTVAGVVQSGGYSVTTINGGGAVTFDTAPVNGADILIESVPSFMQEAEFANEGGFQPETFDVVHDRLAAGDLYLLDRVERALVLPRGASGDLSGVVAGQFLALDGVGNVVGASGTGADAGLRTDMAADTGLNLIGFQQTGTGAVPRTALAKAREAVSISDFGAVAGDTGNQRSAIQAALDAVHTAGGGTILVPPGTYRITAALTLYANIDLVGEGRGSVIHLVNTARSGAIVATGTLLTPLTNIKIRNLTLLGDATFTAGTPSVVNGQGIFLTYTDDCEIENCWVSGFSDGGIFALDGSNNSFSNNRVRYCAQGLGFLATNINATGNIATGNRISNIGTYNGLHLEGGFGPGSETGMVVHTALIGNTIADIWEAGINVELAPYTTCTGNTVVRAGMGATTINMGVKLYGGYKGSLIGNTITDCNGQGIVVGANSGDAAVSGNATSGNAGSCLVTDSGGVAASLNISMGINAFTEGDVTTSGNVSFRTRTRGFKLSNVADSDLTTLDWYEEGTFTPVIVGTSAAGAATYTVQVGRFTRIGNIVNVFMTIGWSAHTGTGNMRLTGLPYANGASVKSTLTIAPNGLALPSGAVLQTIVPQSQAYVDFNSYVSTAGVQTALPMDAAVDEMTLSGSYRV